MSLPASMSLDRVDVDLQVDGRRLPRPGDAVGDDPGQDQQRHQVRRARARPPSAAPAAAVPGRRSAGPWPTWQVTPVISARTASRSAVVAAIRPDQVRQTRAVGVARAPGARAGGRPPGRRPAWPRRAGSVRRRSAGRPAAGRWRRSPGRSVPAAAGRSAGRRRARAAPPGCGRAATARRRGRRSPSSSAYTCRDGMSPATILQKMQSGSERLSCAHVGSRSRVVRPPRTAAAGRRPADRPAARTRSWPRRRAGRSARSGSARAGDRAAAARDR